MGVCVEDTTTALSFGCRLLWAVMGGCLVCPCTSSTSQTSNSTSNSRVQVSDGCVLVVSEGTAGEEEGGAAVQYAN